MNSNLKQIVAICIAVLSTSAHADGKLLKGIGAEYIDGCVVHAEILTAGGPGGEHWETHSKKFYGFGEHLVYSPIGGSVDVKIEKGLVGVSKPQYRYKVLDNCTTQAVKISGLDPVTGQTVSHIFTKTPAVSIFDQSTIPQAKRDVLVQAVKVKGAIVTQSCSTPSGPPPKCEPGQDKPATFVPYGGRYSSSQWDITVARDTKTPQTKNVHIFHYTLSVEHDVEVIDIIGNDVPGMTNTEPTHIVPTTGTIIYQ